MIELPYAPSALRVGIRRVIVAVLLVTTAIVAANVPDSRADPGPGSPVPSADPFYRFGGSTV
ncbi:hypothetical protein QSJ19_12885 [Gordonia sp. ABSL11-1]|uniref:hypothetical protein n=1 Tax=Gordonia sp. ABSL11-1 TaxID=3053924 RepID=UPI00257418C3|nr:hypothetical protein [Gordonia sp. ABSL11-1]MDL9946472.1 hypothetical protein [Gordonia sp. ABSL11-1]